MQMLHRINVSCSVHNYCWCLMTSQAGEKGQELSTSLQGTLLSKQWITIEYTKKYQLTSFPVGGLNTLYVQSVLFYLFIFFEWV